MIANEIVITWDESGRVWLRFRSNCSVAVVEQRLTECRIDAEEIIPFASDATRVNGGDGYWVRLPAGITVTDKLREKIESL